MSTLRRRVNETAAQRLSEAAAATSAAGKGSPNVSSGTPKWFKIYYSVLMVCVVLAIAAYLILRSPYNSHPSFDPFEFLPTNMRKELVFWYRDHGITSSPSSTTTTGAPRNLLPDMVNYLARFEGRGYFDNPAIKGYDHFMESTINGWIAGVFETIRLDADMMKMIESEEKGVGSIPGGSRRLKEGIRKAVSPITTLLLEEAAKDDDETTGNSASSSSAPTTTASDWARLASDHQTWVFEGLSHCHTSACRMAKMQLMTLWRDKMQLMPEHRLKDKWTMLTQLFHPDTHPYRLIDAPASADTLGSLWARFFSTGDVQYLARLVELTRITGAPAYQSEKDREIREWTAKKRARSLQKYEEDYEEAVKEAKEKNLPTPAKPAPPKEGPPLPKSPTLELHALFYNSLLYYAGDHPSVKQAVHHSWTLYSDDPINKMLMRTTPFKINGVAGSE